MERRPNVVASDVLAASIELCGAGPCQAKLSRAPSWKDLIQRAGPSLAEPIRTAWSRTDQSEAHRGEARKASWLGALAGGSSWTLTHETQNGNFLTNYIQGMLPRRGRCALPHNGNNESSVLQQRLMMDMTCQPSAAIDRKGADTGRERYSTSALMCFCGCPRCSARSPCPAAGAT